MDERTPPQETFIDRLNKMAQELVELENKLKEA